MHEPRRFPCLVAALFVLAALSSQVQGFPGGAPPTFTGSPNSGGFDCSLCHAGGGGSGSVELLGVPGVVEADTVYDLLVRVIDAEQVGAGFEISVEDDDLNFIGTLIVTDATNTRFAQGNTNWITQTDAGYDDSLANWVSSGNSVDYAFQWLSPLVLPTDPFSFYAAGNATNNDDSFDGDHVYTTSARIPEPASLALFVMAGIGWRRRQGRT